MKILRLKKAQKILDFYSTNFNYREPYQILVDGTFAQGALQNKVAIEEQLTKYIQHKVKLITTQCIILEMEKLGPVLTGATLIVKNFIVHKCGHEGKPLVGSNCINSLIKESRYIIATQDKSLQDRSRKIPGQALLYLHKSAPVLEGPSDATKKKVAKKTTQMLTKGGKELKRLKKEQGMEIVANSMKVKRKGPKNPNPLSCKKKQAKSKESCSGKLSNNSTKIKRKRIKISGHIKQHLNNIP